MKTAFIFPAFISEYIGTEVQILDSLSIHFRENLNKATKSSGIDFNGFSLDNISFTEEELRSQLISYIFSCSLSDALTSRGIEPDMLAGYSMGLYAAMFTGGVIDFEEGIRLIIKAFELSKKALGDLKAGMGSIIGLTVAEINEIILKNQLKAEVANTNSVHSHLVTGQIDALQDLLTHAREIGALNVSVLNVQTPYHSQLLKETQVEFRQYISREVNLKKSRFPILSSINQHILESPEEICTEIANNLFKSINWKNSFERMLSMGIHQFIECGAGKSLQKISRFEAGDFKVYPMNKLGNIIT